MVQAQRQHNRENGFLCTMESGNVIRRTMIMRENAYLSAPGISIPWPVASDLHFHARIQLWPTRDGLTRGNLGWTKKEAA